MIKAVHKRPFFVTDLAIAEPVSKNRDIGDGLRWNSAGIWGESVYSLNQSLPYSALAPNFRVVITRTDWRSRLVWRASEWQAGSPDRILGKDVDLAEETAKLDIIDLIERKPVIINEARRLISTPEGGNFRHGWRRKIFEFSSSVWKNWL